MNTTLYRYFDVDDRLLYVGITKRGRKRAVAHAAQSIWWPQVRSATFEHFGTTTEAEAAERRAIRDESPAHNRLGNPLAPPRLRTYRPTRASTFYAENVERAKRELTELARRRGL